MHNSLMTTRAVFYRTRPDEAGFDLCNEASALRLIAEPTDEQKARLVEIETGRVLVDEYKYTLGTMSALKNAYRKARLRESRAWVEAQVGMTSDALFDVPVDQRDRQWTDNVLFFTAALSWSVVLVSLIKVEFRQVDMLSDFHTAWETILAPEAWNTVEGYLDSIDQDLLDALNAQVDKLSPRMLTLSGDAESKKFGVVNGTL